MKTSDIIKYVFMIILILFIVYSYINLIILTVQTNKRTKTFCIDTFTYNTGSMIGTAPLKSNDSYTKCIGIKYLDAASGEQPVFIGSMEIPTYRTGKCNVIIGEGAGKHLTTESYCVIIGSSNLAVYASGADMLWIVDWNEPYLLKNPEIKIYFGIIILIIDQIMILKKIDNYLLLTKLLTNKKRNVKIMKCL